MPQVEAYVFFSQHQDGGQRFFSKQESVVFMYCECDSNQVLGKMSISIKVYDPSFFQVDCCLAPYCRNTHNY